MDPPTRPRFKVLLVDDCVAERDLYECVLEQEFNILTAARGAAGVMIAAHNHPDAIVLDVLMPEMDGWETCTRLKHTAETADIPVILLTGVDDRDLRRHARAVGASAVLRKPCPADRLRETIFTVVGDLGHHPRFL